MNPLFLWRVNASLIALACGFGCSTSSSEGMSPTAQAGGAQVGAGGAVGSSGMTGANGDLTITLGIGGSSGSGGNSACGGTCKATVAYCGDGIINQTSEACDDGNAIGGDGCTASCDQIEDGWACPTPGLPCVNTAACGDNQELLGNFLRR